MRVMLEISCCNTLMNAGSMDVRPGHAPYDPGLSELFAVALRIIFLDHMLKRAVKLALYR